jgi:hypothetical protein
MRPDRTILSLALLILVVITVAFGGSMSSAGTMFITNLFTFNNGTLSFNGTLNMSWYNISNVMTVAPGDAANKSYVDAAILSGGGGATTWNLSVTNSTQYSIQVQNISWSNASMKAYVDSTTGTGWNESYFLRDASRTITSEKVRRNVDNDLLTLYGGNSIAGGTGGIISLYGKDTVAARAVEVAVGDGGVGNKLAVGWVAGEYPVMTLNNNTIIHLVTGLNGGSAVNKSYVDWNLSVTNSTQYSIQVQNISWSNASMKAYVDSVAGTGAATTWNLSVTNSTQYSIQVQNISWSNASMKAYVDAAIAGVGGGSGDTSGFLFTNGTRVMNGNLNMGGNTIINATEYRPFNRTRAVVIESDFFDGSTDAIPGLLGAAISSGTVAGVATTANHPGVIYMRDSTTAAGGYRFGCAGTQLIAGKEVFDVIFQTNGVRTAESTKFGWGDATAAATLPTDGIWFNITKTAGVATNRLYGNTSSNSARSGTRTYYDLTTSTWYRGIIQVNDAASLVTYSVYSDAGALLWTDTVSTNIPTGAGRDTSPCIIVAESSTDAAADILRLDYVKWDTNRTLTRG